MRPKYSVIIPVYNAEKTLRRCIDSLLSQHFSDAEIILVNDGSKDDSGAICEEYAEEHRNIRYVSQQNGGVSAARNAGLDAAQGEYVLFVDSDDYVTPNCFSGIEQAVESGKADWIQFSGYVDSGTERRKLARSPGRSASREELMPHIVDAICRKTINGPWAKLYRREIIEKHSIRFPVGASVAEDRAFNIVYSFFIQNYSVSETAVYVLNTENDNSLSRKRHDDLEKQFEIADSFLYRELAAALISDREKEAYHQALNFGVCRAIYHDAKLMIQDGVGWFSRQMRLMHLCRKVNRKHMKYPKTRYCSLISLPVRLHLTPVIDAVARKLMRGS